jgi:rubrerythrin
MNLNNIYQQKHQLWLKFLFASFGVSNQKIKDELYEMANIEFRHMKWLSNRLKAENLSYNYEREVVNINQESNHGYFSFLKNEITTIHKNYISDDMMFDRMKSDEEYFLVRLDILLSQEDEKVSAFNKERIYEGKELDKTSTDALTYFLFEETYKEYELIMVYAYMQNYTDNVTLYNVYQDLIDESQYHLKCFGNMLSKMGILSLPRVIIEQIYKRDDIKQFFLDGIDEEKAAKEECRKLSEAVKDDELSKFFTYINYQESYHIELMQRAISEL